MAANKKSSNLKIADKVIEVTIRQEKDNDDCGNHAGHLPVPQQNPAGKQDNEGKKPAQDHGAVDVTDGDLSDIMSSQPQGSIQSQQHGMPGKRGKPLPINSR